MAPTGAAKAGGFEKDGYLGTTGPADAIEISVNSETVQTTLDNGPAPALLFTVPAAFDEEGRLTETRLNVKTEAVLGTYEFEMHTFVYGGLPDVDESWDFLGIGMGFHRVHLFAYDNAADPEDPWFEMAAPGRYGLLRTASTFLLPGDEERTYLLVIEGDDEARNHGTRLQVDVTTEVEGRVARLPADVELVLTTDRYRLAGGVDVSVGTRMGRTGADGRVLFEGLDAGTYLLKLGPDRTGEPIWIDDEGRVQQGGVLLVVPGGYRKHSVVLARQEEALEWASAWCAAPNPEGRDFCCRAEAPPAWCTSL